MEEENAEVASAVNHLLNEMVLEVNGTSDHMEEEEEEVEEEEEEAMEVVKDDEFVPARLVISGFHDASEDIIQMTIEEACSYVSSKVESFIRDPNINPLLLLKNQISSLEDRIKTKNEEFTKLHKMFEVLYRDQIKFLRHMNILDKAETKEQGVSVDMAWLPETVSGIIREDLLKKSAENKSQLSTSGGSSTGDAAPKRPTKGPTGSIECIDLTDDDVTEVAVSTSSSSASVSTPSTSVASSTKHSLLTADLSKHTSITITPINPSQNNPSTSGAKSNVSGPSTSVVKANDSKHPAPLPLVPPSSDASEILPRPDLSISSDKNGIVLQWDYPPEIRAKKIMGYEIVGYQEKSSMAPSLNLWKKIGCVSPMPLPMSCTLTQFVEGFRYHFSIRALNKDCKPGHFSNPATIMFSSDTRKRTTASTL